MKFANHGSAVQLSLALGIFAVLGAAPTPSVSQMFTPMKPRSDNEPVAQDRLLSLPSDAEPEEPAETAVSYAVEQADRGEERFLKECEDCHGVDLKGGLNGGAPLRGVAFEQKYAVGLPASVMFGFMSSTMPPNAPGRYSPEVYADLMAYILQRNGFRPGAPLPSDLDALNYLIVDK